MKLKNFKEFSYIKENNEESKKWDIYAGLGGGFGGAQKVDTFIGTEKEANDFAYESAIEYYEGHVGLHGLRTTEDIMEEDDVSEDEANEIYNEEREGWLDYYVKLCRK